MIYDLQFIGEYLLSSSRDKTIKCWNSNDLSIVQRLDFKSKGHKHSVNALLPLSTDSFVSCSDDRQVISWKIKV
jgi:WD40 repeat protein